MGVGEKVCDPDCVRVLEGVWDRVENCVSDCVALVVCVVVGVCVTVDSCVLVDSCVTVATCDEEGVLVAVAD